MDSRPKNGYGYIYKYTSPIGKSYIGQTIRSLSERAGKEGKEYIGCKAFYAAIKEFGFSNFTVEILEEVKIEELDSVEIKYIEKFNTRVPNGYNISPGGKIFRDKDTKHVYQYSSEDGHFIKEWESVKDILNYLEKDYKSSFLEGCLNYKNFTAYGYCWSYEKMEKYPIEERLINNKTKKVLQFSLDGTLIKEYESISEAARSTGAERSAIKRCCRGELRQHHGYIWKCDEIIMEKKYKNKAISVEQIDPETDEVIQVFKSISEASRLFSKETSQIRRVLDTNKLAYGFRWKTHSRFND